MMEEKSQMHKDLHVAEHLSRMVWKATLVVAHGLLEQEHLVQGVLFAQYPLPDRFGQVLQAKLKEGGLQLPSY